MRFLIFVMCLHSASLFAQNYSPLVKTNFNKFIEKPSVEWAIYSNDTLQTILPDLREILLKKMKDKKIKIFGEEIAENSSENNLNNKSANYDLTNMAPSQSVLIYDSLGNEISASTEVISDQGPIGILNIYQIFHVENGKLLSYISRVSPLKNIVITSGVFLGRSEYFSTALNMNPFFKKDKKDKIIFLKTTKTIIVVDSIAKNNRLKETFGHNLIETLWPYIISNKLSIFNAGTNQSTTIDKINHNNELNLETVAVPIYDSLGNLEKNKPIFINIGANNFDKISLIQRWYYNDTKNIVYCIIPEAYLFLKRLDKNATIKDLKPALKIAF